MKNNNSSTTIAVILLLLGIGTGALMPWPARAPRKSNSVPPPRANMEEEVTNVPRRRTEALEHENDALRGKLAQEKSAFAAQTRPTGRVRDIPASYIRMEAVADDAFGDQTLTDEIVDFLGITPRQRESIDAILTRAQQQLWQNMGAHAKLTKLDRNEAGISISPFPEAGDGILNERNNAVIAVLGPDNGAFLNAKMSQTNYGASEMAYQLKRTENGFQVSMQAPGLGRYFSLKLPMHADNPETNIFIQVVPPQWLKNSSQRK